MWVKVVKSGLINWFANGKTSGTKKFYTKTEGAVVPPKVWTHVAGTFDGAKGIVVVSLIKLHQNSFLNDSIVYSKLGNNIQSDLFISEFTWKLKLLD